MNAIDTNILVYRVDQFEPTKQLSAIQLLHKLTQGTDTLLPWQVLAEFANWLIRKQHTKHLSRTAVRAYLDATRQQFTLVMPMPDCLDRALDLAEQHTLSHWDSMLVAACLEAGVTTLYTEDMGTPRKIETLELINPFSATPKTS